MCWALAVRNGAESNGYHAVSQSDPAQRATLMAAMLSEHAGIGVIAFAAILLSFALLLISTWGRFGELNQQRNLVGAGLVLVLLVLVGLGMLGEGFYLLELKNLAPHLKN